MDVEVGDFNDDRHHGDTDKANAAMYVDVGDFDDNRDVLGIAPAKKLVFSRAFDTPVSPPFARG